MNFSFKLSPGIETHLWASGDGISINSYARSEPSPILTDHSTSRTVQVVRITVRPVRVLIFCLIFIIDHFKTRSGQKFK